MKFSEKVSQIPRILQRTCIAFEDPIYIPEYGLKDGSGFNSSLALVVVYEAWSSEDVNGLGSKCRSKQFISRGEETIRN